MASFTAKDVQALRQSTGAGMMDAKKALEATDGDAAAAGKWLREQGLIKAAARTDRANEQGTVAVASSDAAVAIVQLKTETDFTAKSEGVLSLVQTLADAVASGGEAALAEHTAAVEDLALSTKENIEVGQVIRFERAEGRIVEPYLHVQDGRGVNAVLIELDGGTPEIAHDVAVHLAFTKAPYLSRDDVPADEVAAEREQLEKETRAEGKPEQAIEKIVEGKLTGWFKQTVLLEQGFVRDEKTQIKDYIGNATIVRVAQVVIGS
jgi:elongation factor Ts